VVMALGEVVGEVVGFLSSHKAYTTEDWGFGGAGSPMLGQLRMVLNEGSLDQWATCISELDTDLLHHKLN
jgi:hypothetical protein